MYEYLNEQRPRKVAIYARVSTEHEEQLSALENQIDWYGPIMAAHKEWDVVARYVDEGITGTSAKVDIAPLTHLRFLLVCFW